MEYGTADVLHGDFETFSYCDLRKAGGYRYAAHKSTEILCFSWAINDGEVTTWVPCITKAQARQHGLPINQFWRYGLAIPADLAEAIEAGITFAAHNVSFERAIWELIVVKKHDGPHTKRSQFNCTSIRAAAAHLPRSLEGAAMALDAKNQKDSEGKRLLKKFAMPRKPTKADDRTRIMPLDEPEEFKALCNYCVADVMAERDIDKQLPQLHPLEQKLLAFDMLINERGLLIDIESARKASIVLRSLEANIVADVQRRTECTEYPEGLRPTQGVKMLKFFQDMGVALENLQADHVRKYLRDNIATLPDLARELLLLRIEAGRSSTKKFISMEHYAGTGDNRARGTMLMYGAHTGRFCLAKGSLVITGRGNIPVEEVINGDTVWDGISWVTCEGAVYSGRKPVIKRRGVVATPDHMVWLSPHAGTQRLADAPGVWQCMPDERPRCTPNPEYNGETEAETYDIVNAGPRNRFALSNGCIVSNSGRGIQPHNFSRGTLKYEEVLRVFELLKLADHEVFSMLYEWPISTIGSTMRGYIIPTPGKIFRVADYASIEARVLAWLAQEAWVLEVYASGQNLYKRMAAAVFNIPGDPELLDKNCNEYKIGKNLILGCIQIGTPVLSDRGWVPIETITLEDKLWDGVEWVTHQGLLDKGLKPVVNVMGIGLTPDHLILTSKQWFPAGHVSKRPNLYRSAVKLASSLLPVMEQTSWAIGNTGISVFVNAVRSTTKTILRSVNRQGCLDVIHVFVNTLRRIIPLENILMSSSEKHTARTKFWKSLTLFQHAGWPNVSTADLSNTDREISTTTDFNRQDVTTVGLTELISLTRTRTGYTENGTISTLGPRKKIPMLLSAASKLSNAGLAYRTLLKTLARCLGIGPAQTTSFSTGSTTIAITAPETVGLQPSSKTSITVMPTMDIYKCGPRSRFFIRTPSNEPLIVHNCGYGLGAAKFVAYSEKAGVEISESFAKQAVGSYRKKHPKIVQFWGDVERCAITAVQRKSNIERPIILRNLSFYMDGQWLCIRLPSGRPMRYYRPKVVPVEKFGNPSLQLQYKTEFRGRLVSESSYGGKLVENLTQAIARDLLVNGMFQAEAHGYPVYGTVHDEIITEQYPHEGSVHELEKIICIKPEWADGIPLAAEGFESGRYRK